MWIDHYDPYDPYVYISAIPPMVNDAKQVALAPRDNGAANNWRDSNDRLLNSVRGVGDAIGGIPTARPPSRNYESSTSNRYNEQPNRGYDSRSYADSISRASPALPPSTQMIHHREVSAPTPPVIHNKVR